MSTVLDGIWSVISRVSCDWDHRVLFVAFLCLSDRSLPSELISHNTNASFGMKQAYLHRPHVVVVIYTKINILLFIHGTVDVHCEDDFKGRINLTRTN